MIVEVMDSYTRLNAGIDVDTAIIDALNKDRHWFGDLTLWNAKAFGRRLFRMFNRKIYTTVTIWRSPSQMFYDDFDPRPDVHTSLILESVNIHGGHVFWSDSYGVRGISTRARDAFHAHALKQKATYRMYDIPYILIEQDTLRITHRAPAKNVISTTMRMHGSEAGLLEYYPNKQIPPAELRILEDK